MNFSPKVSIIIPVYKREEYLSECFYSALRQTFEEIEVIIVDKGELDEARELIDIFEKKDPRIVAPHIKNNGYGASCNIGLECAKGEYVFFLESDDYILPDTIEKMYNYAKSLNADIVKTPYMEFFANGKKQDCPHRKSMGKKLPHNSCFSVKEYGELLEIHASLWSCLYKKAYLNEKKIRFIEAPGAGYVDVGFRIDSLIQTKKIAWLDEALYHYRVDSLGSSTNTFDVSVMIKRWREVHEKFAAHQNDYDMYYGPHLILDEYLNTVYRAHLSPLTKKEREEIIYNLSYVSEKMIKETTNLTYAQKKELIEFKQDKTPLLVNTQDKKQNPNIKIFSSYRIDQENIIIKNPIIFPVRCGAYYSKEKDCTIPGDNTGDNISQKRKSFCELTVQYWAWKNIDADYYGLCHYRRYISFLDNLSGPIDDHGELVESRRLSAAIAKEYGLTDPDEMSSIITQYDAIGICSIDVNKIPTPTGRHKTVYDFWSKGCINLLAPTVIDKLIHFIKVRQPSYYQATIEYFKQSKHRGYNTFILTKKLFFELCEFEFDILFALEQELNFEYYSELMARTPGYIGEILSAIFLYKIESSDKYKFCERQLVVFQDCLVHKRQILKPFFNKNNIPIFFTSSEFNVPYLGVCLDSMLQHFSPQNNYDIIVLSTDIGKGSEEKLTQTLSKRDNVKIRFFDPTSVISDENFCMNIAGYITLPFYKAFLAWLFPFYDKAIVLDSDLIINTDIAQILEVDLQDKFIAAVKDIVFQGLLNGKEPGWLEFAKTGLQLDEPYNYVNAGVMVMNLECIRKSLILEDLMAVATSNNLKLADQDLINVSFGKNVVFLDPKWNCFIQTNQWVKDCMDLASVKDLDAYKKSKNSPSIIHFANNPKPWGNPSIPNGSEWWSIARSGLYYEELLIRLTNFQIQTFHPVISCDNRSGARRLADKLMPPGTSRREIAKWFLPKGSLRWRLCKQIYYIFKPQYRPPKNLL